ncbi:MAG: TFIIB-type zinc ribbon-containing protein [archaeon]
MSARQIKEKIVCPNCGSPYIEYASLREESGSLVGIGIPEKYYCPRCGYRGSVVLEMTSEQLKRRRFSKKEWSEHPLRVTKRSSEAVKPIFTIMLLLFFFAAFSLMIPRYQILKEPQPVNIYDQGSIQFIPSGDEMSIKESGQAVKYGELYYSVQSSGLSYVDRALGLQNVGGFLVPMFFLLFIAGFMALMLYSHWHRVQFFG